MRYQNPLTLTVDELRELSNFSHWIPITRGFHHKYMAEKYPGWEWNQLIPRLIKGGYISKSDNQPGRVKLMQGLSISEDVKAIEFKAQSDGSVVVKVIRGSDE
jgi:hypothetical protein